MTVTDTDTDTAFLADVCRIADEVAAKHALDVDANARFPHESIDALRAAGGLGAFLGPEHGGPGISFETIATACFELGRRCGASAMVFAMHQIQVISMARHREGHPFFDDYLRRVVSEQRLVASATSEVGKGGDMGISIASLEPAGDGQVRFVKEGPTVSYGAHADDLFTTVRRAPDAEPSDQVAVLSMAGQHQLEQKGTWDPFGMRGTCSPGFVVSATVPEGQALPFADLGPQSMVPVSHVLWSQLWLGIATDAFDRARAFVRASAKRSPGTTPPAATHLSHVMSELSLLRAEVCQGLTDYVGHMDDREWLSTLQAVLRFNNLKLAASEQAPRVCQGAMGVSGIVGYKNDTPFAVGRHLRDSMSACLMIANERIHQTNAGLLLIAKDV
ncbi:MAG: acyl-CoA dehydrogenase [Solirubrobacteraceae bacterium]|jgi:acyl-CoA dehydrogenase|nr:acyl-CoA dehydrogenase [Solirubrobacteraceae bacterium]